MCLFTICDRNFAVFLSQLTIFNFHVITGNLILIGLEGSRSIQHGKSRRSLLEVLSRLRRSLPASGRSVGLRLSRHLTKGCRERTSGTQGIRILPWVPEACLALSSLSYYTPAPSNVQEVRSLLSMTTYCAWFIPGYVTLTQPL